VVGRSRPYSDLNSPRTRYRTVPSADRSRLRCPAAANNGQPRIPTFAFPCLSPHATPRTPVCGCVVSACLQPCRTGVAYRRRPWALWRRSLAAGASGDRRRVGVQCTRIDDGPSRSRLVWTHHLRAVTALRVLPTTKPARPLRWQLIRWRDAPLYWCRFVRNGHLAGTDSAMLNPAATRPESATYPPLRRTAVALAADARRGTRSPPPRGDTVPGVSVVAQLCVRRSPVHGRPPARRIWSEVAGEAAWVSGSSSEGRAPKAVSQLPFRAVAVNTAAGSKSTPGCVRSPPLRSSGRSAIAPQVGWTSATNSVLTQGTNDAI
jgi:hypothetical protein